MKIVVMAGGKGSRMGGLEKPMLRICGRRILEAVLEAAYDLSSRIYVAVSPSTPKTREWCMKENVAVIDTPGKGYSYDVGSVLERLDPPILFLPADTPFITSKLLRRFVEEALAIDADIVTLLVSRHCFPQDMAEDELAPIGISLFKRKHGYWANVIMCSFPELLDIDTVKDLERAIVVCGE